MNFTEVYRQTVSYCNQNRSKFPVPKSQVFEGTDYKLPFQENFTKQKTTINIVEEDTIVAGEKLRDQGFSVVCLNLASERNPGGGVTRGARAQEESLFRRTNYFQHLNKSLVKYPLKPVQVVYTPDVAIVRNVDLTAKSDNIECLSFIACAGLRNPNLVNGKLTVGQYNLLKHKIRLVLQVAVLKGHNAVVLGALGCGAFHNPPLDVAVTFKEVMKEFDGRFKIITFAILGKPNFTVFRDVFSSQSVRN